MLIHFPILQSVGSYGIGLRSAGAWVSETISMTKYAIARERSRCINLIRSFFVDQGYLEVDTPVLAPFLIPEPSIEAFATTLLGPDEDSRPLYLTPSPELWMKRLVGLGYGKIFQISKCFRNAEPRGRFHRQEFTMLEWYTPDQSYLEEIELTERLLAMLLRDSAIVRASNRYVRDVTPPFHRLSNREAFLRFASFDLSATQEKSSLVKEANRLGISVSTDDSWEQVFHRIFLSIVEPALPREKPMILYDYPAQIPTLAAPLPGTPYAQRWELYLGAVEIANCYQEEIDSEKVEDFISAESVRKRSCRVQHVIDTGLSSVFTPEYPRCSGVAVGIDRLLTVLFDRSSIEGVNHFPLSDTLYEHP